MDSLTSSVRLDSVAIREEDEQMGEYWTPKTRVSGSENNGSLLMTGHLLAHLMHCTWEVELLNPGVFAMFLCLF